MRLINGERVLSKHGFFQITQKVFLRKGNSLLVMKDRKSGFGDLPGGRMDETEFFDDWQVSVRRELEEEMGNKFQYEIEPKPFLIHKHRVTEGNHPCIILGYKGIYRGGEIVLSDEHDFMEWVDINNYKPDSFFEDYMLEAVQIYLKEYA
jgi:8-oxo-dGTP pyrophosphatase MutT (NUDIX family)